MSSAISRRSASGLAMDKLKPGQVNFTWFELVIVCPHMWWEIAGLSFILGFSNAHAFLQFNVFATIQTGNFIFLINDAITNQPSGTINFLLAVIILHTVVGTFISSSIMLTWKVREKSLLIILSLFIIIGSISEICWKELSCDGHICPGQQFRPSNWSSLGIITGVGVIAHWTLKLGYVLPYQTGNMMKMSETLYRYLFGVSIDEKTTGDTFQNAMIFIGFYSGVAVECAIAQKGAPTIIPVLVIAFIMCLVQIAKLYNAESFTLKLKALLDKIAAKERRNNSSPGENNQDGGPISVESEQFDNDNETSTNTRLNKSRLSNMAGSQHDAVANFRHTLLASAINQQILDIPLGHDHAENSVFSESFTQQDAIWYTKSDLNANDRKSYATYPSVANFRQSAAPIGRLDRTMSQNSGSADESTSDVELGKSGQSTASIASVIDRSAANS